MNNVMGGAPQQSSGINFWFIAKWVLILGLIILGVKYFYDARKERTNNYTGNNATPAEPVKLQVKRGRKKKKKTASSSMPPVPQYKSVKKQKQKQQNNKNKQNKPNNSNNKANKNNNRHDDDIIRSLYGT